MVVLSGWTQWLAERLDLEAGLGGIAWPTGLTGSCHASLRLRLNVYNCFLFYIHHN